MLKIVQKKNKHAVYASGLWNLERAQKWLDQYNPQMWIDKIIQKDDLEIVPEASYAKAS